jgi:hypothetical protein
LSGIVHLDIPAAELNLRYCRDSGYRGVEVWQYHVTGGEFVAEDTAVGTYVYFDS